MTSPGSPRTRFNRAIERRSLINAELAARELGRLGLADALALTMLYAESDDPRFERAAVRLTGRFALERDTATLESLVTLASALAAGDGERARAVLDS